MSGCFACGASRNGFFAAAQAGETGNSGALPWLLFFGFAAAGGALVYLLARRSKG